MQFTRAVARALVVLAASAPLASQAQEKGQTQFPTADAAVQGLIRAVRARDTAGLVHILGTSSEKLVFSGDPVEDESGRQLFVKKAEESTKLVAVGDQTVLYVGPGRWPFPFPLRQAQSQWYFDTRAGLREALLRRIGENELNAMEVCRAVTAAEALYRKTDYNADGVLEYAGKFRSSPGKQDGLYWPTKPGQPESPLGPLVAKAESEGYHGGKAQPVPYHGYYYRILKAQGPHAPGGDYSYLIHGRMLAGFAVLAYPARWGASGVMTFIINQDGRLYQRNLGASTSNVAPGVSELNPDANWQEVKE